MLKCKLFKSNNSKWVWKLRHGKLQKEVNRNAISCEDTFVHYHYYQPYCGNCKKVGGTFLKYCGNCGAKMDKESLTPPRFSC